MKLELAVVCALLMVPICGAAQDPADSTTTTAGSTSTTAKTQPSGNNPITGPTTTPKAIVTTKDPIEDINVLVNNVTTKCDPIKPDFNCKSVADDINTKPTKDEKCSYYKDKLPSCVNKNCTNAGDLKWNIDELNKICNGASLFRVSTLLLCYLAVAYRFIHG